MTKRQSFFESDLLAKEWLKESYGGWSGDFFRLKQEIDKKIALGKIELIDYKDNSYDFPKNIELTSQYLKFTTKQGRLVIIDLSFATDFGYSETPYSSMYFLADAKDEEQVSIGVY